LFFQEEDGIRDAQESRGLGDVYKRQASRFRPLVERKTDTGMAILKSILDEVNAGKVREIADA